jgi:hypothetical protein
MKNLLLATLLLSAASRLSATTYFVATNGSDINVGTSTNAPFFTLAPAIAQAAPGDTIWIRGGTYFYTNVFPITNSGTPGLPIKVWNYPNEHPALCFSNMPYTGNIDTNIGFWLQTNASWWYFKGLEVCYAADSGMKIQGCNNTVEFCVFHHNRDTGLQIGLGDGDDNDGSVAASNIVINCDSYLNYDPHSSGGNADGLDCKLSPGAGNMFIGCRSWHNSDDGFDFFKSNFRIVVSNCWTWHNGDPADFSGSAGNAEGFKLGGDTDFAAPHLVIRCISFNNHFGGSSAGRAFHQNDNQAGLTLYNCLSFSNNYNYALNNDFADSSQHHVVVNCVGFAGITKNNDFNGSTLQTNNSWNLTNIVADASDFVDLSEAAASAPRQPDGSLPTGFARLAAGSDLIDKGVNVGLPFNGSAPDLGAFEYTNSTSSQGNISFNTSPAAMGWTNGGFQLTVSGLTSHGPVVIFVSTDFSAWTPIVTNPAVTGSLVFLDSSTTNAAHRFYRAEEQ